jgi:glycerol-3-phosphate acyltransferase PlsY
VVFALGVVSIDVGKAALAVAVLPGLRLAGPVDAEVSALACGFAAVVGHCYPLYHGFRGGKGAATAVGALAVIQPWLLVPMILTWLVVLAVTGYVGAATVLAGVSLVPAVVWQGGSTGLVAFCCGIALFMAFTHRSNLGRLRAGTENRFEKARLVNWFRK